MRRSCPSPGGSALPRSLKALVVDVATGGWKMVVPETASDARFSSRWSRRSADQKLVEALKAQGYRNLVAALAGS